MITNHYDQDISYLQVAAIFYDDAGKIIGGGTTYLNFLLANTSAGIIIPVTSNGEIARVEMFPSITGFFEGVSEQYPEGASKLEISKQGFGQGERNIGYGMMIKNPNQDYALEGSMYQITAYTNDGNVAGVYEGYVDLLLPNQILGFGGEMYLEEEVAVSRIDVQIKEGVFTPSNANSSLTSKNVTFIPDDYSPEVTGEIMNPYDKEVTNIPVYALGFNEAGEIIGGGNTYLDFIPANASSAVTVNITFSETPASVELYAGVRSISDTGG